MRTLSAFIQWCFIRSLDEPALCTRNVLHLRQRQDAVACFTLQALANIQGPVTARGASSAPAPPATGTARALSALQQRTGAGENIGLGLQLRIPSPPRLYCLALLSSYQGPAGSTAWPCSPQLRSLRVSPWAVPPSAPGREEALLGPCQGLSLSAWALSSSSSSSARDTACEPRDSGCCSGSCCCYHCCCCWRPCPRCRGRGRSAPARHPGRCRHAQHSTAQHSTAWKPRPALTSPCMCQGERASVCPRVLAEGGCRGLRLSRVEVVLGGGRGGHWRTCRGRGSSRG